MDGAFFPALSDGTAAAVRTGYGVLMILTLLQALPEARRFFLSERWGGYAKSSPSVDAIQNPLVMPFVFVVWLGAAGAIAFGWAALWGAFVNLVICRYFFIHMRWKGVLRGLGAPGFIAYWLGLAVLLLEYTRVAAPGLRSLALLVVQVDLALIMLSAGLYKMTAGYPRNHGMELGLCNPMWGYWWRRYVRLAPSHPVYWTLNQLAWGTEVVAAVLMLIPLTREMGGLLISGSFVFILTQIRLGFLCEMVVLAGLLYVTPDSGIDTALAGIASTAAIAPVPAGAAITATNLLLAAGLWTYLLALPFAHAGLYYNFYARRSLPAPLQRLLERWTNAFGIIVWRVFSVDLVNFFVRVYTEAPAGGGRALASRLGSWPRWNHVGEMICLTSLFTTLKYYPGNDEVFRDRLVRYARTVQPLGGGAVVFEYVRVEKRETRHEWVTAAEYRVDLDAGTVEERLLDASFSPRSAHPVSPVHEGLTPGSYAPAGR